MEPRRDDGDDALLVEVAERLADDAAMEPRRDDGDDSIHSSFVTSVLTGRNGAPS